MVSKCNTAVSRAQGGARRCCCQPFTRRDALPVQVYCRAQHRARWSATVSVETDAGTRLASVAAGGLLTSTRSRCYASSGCGALWSSRTGNTSGAGGGSRSSPPFLRPGGQSRTTLTLGRSLLTYVAAYYWPGEHFIYGYTVCDWSLPRRRWEVHCPRLTRY